MARTKQKARVSTGGKCPRKSLAERFARNSGVKSDKQSMPRGRGGNRIPVFRGGAGQGWLFKFPTQHIPGYASPPYAAGHRGQMVRLGTDDAGREQLTAMAKKAANIFLRACDLEGAKAVLPQETHAKMRTLPAADEGSPSLDKVREMRIQMHHELLKVYAAKNSGIGLVPIFTCAMVGVGEGKVCGRGHWSSKDLPAPLTSTEANGGSLTNGPACTVPIPVEEWGKAVLKALEEARQKAVIRHEELYDGHDEYPEEELPDANYVDARLNGLVLSSNRRGGPDGMQAFGKKLLTTVRGAPGCATCPITWGTGLGGAVSGPDGGSVVPAVDFDRTSLTVQVFVMWAGNACKVHVGQTRSPRADVNVRDHDNMLEQAVVLYDAQVFGPPTQGPIVAQHLAATKQVVRDMLSGAGLPVADDGCQWPASGWADADREMTELQTTGCNEPEEPGAMYGAREINFAEYGVRGVVLKDFPPLPGSYGLRGAAEVLSSHGDADETRVSGKAVGFANVMNHERQVRLVLASGVADVEKFERTLCDAVWRMEGGLRGSQGKGGAGLVGVLVGNIASLGYETWESTPDNVKPCGGALRGTHEMSGSGLFGAGDLPLIKTQTPHDARLHHRYLTVLAEDLRQSLVVHLEAPEQGSEEGGAVWTMCVPGGPKVSSHRGCKEDRTGRKIVCVPSCKCGGLDNLGFPKSGDGFLNTDGAQVTGPNHPNFDRAGESQGDDYEVDVVSVGFPGREAIVPDKADALLPGFQSFVVPWDSDGRLKESDGPVLLKVLEEELRKTADEPQWANRRIVGAVLYLPIGAGCLESVLGEGSDGGASVPIVATICNGTGLDPESGAVAVVVTPHTWGLGVSRVDEWPDGVLRSGGQGSEKTVIITGVLFHAGEGVVSEEGKWAGFSELLSGLGGEGGGRGEPLEDVGGVKGKDKKGKGKEPASHKKGKGKEPASHQKGKGKEPALERAEKEKNPGEDPRKGEVVDEMSQKRLQQVAKLLNLNGVGSRANMSVVRKKVKHAIGGKARPVRFVAGESSKG